MTDPLPKTIPVTILTGFLGAGKTTLLNQCLSDPDLRDTAVVVNEFGEISIDHDLVLVGSRELMVTTTGCICCTASSDVRASLFDLFEASRSGRAPPFTRVIVETTGLADPAPIVNALTAGALPAMGRRDHVVARRFRLGPIIACVDAKTADFALDTSFEAVKQVAFATRIVLTKTDLIENAEADGGFIELRERLVSLNPAAKILTRRDKAFSVADLLEGDYMPDAQSEDVVGWLALDRMFRSQSEGKTPAAPSYHSDDFRTILLVHEGLMTRASLDMLLTILSSTVGATLVRLKGIVGFSDDPDHPVVVHAVQHLMHPPTRLPEWPNDDHRTRLVVIGRGYDEQALVQFFDVLFIDKSRIGTSRGWRAPAVVAAGLTTIILCAVFIHLIGAEPAVPFRDLVSFAIGGSR